MKSLTQKKKKEISGILGFGGGEEYSGMNYGPKQHLFLNPVPPKIKALFWCDQECSDTVSVLQK